MSSRTGVCPFCGGPMYRYAMSCMGCKAQGERNAMFGRKHSPETRAKISARAKARDMSARRREGHPMWSGDAVGPSGGHKRARTWYESLPCAFCEAARTERHHIDGNAANNRPDNIAFLCKPHHRQVHPGNGREPLRDYHRIAEKYVARALAGPGGDGQVSLEDLIAAEVA